VYREKQRKLIGPNEHTQLIGSSQLVDKTIYAHACCRDSLTLQVITTARSLRMQWLCLSLSTLFLPVQEHVMLQRQYLVSEL
jgi:hypothetical protein